MKKESRKLQKLPAKEVLPVEALINEADALHQEIATCLAKLTQIRDRVIKLKGRDSQFATRARYSQGWLMGLYELFR